MSADIKNTWPQIISRLASSLGTRDTVIHLKKAVVNPGTHTHVDTCWSLGVIWRRDDV